VTEDAYDEASAALLAAVATEIGPWVERRVVELAPELGDEAVRAAEQARSEVVGALTVLVATDIDEQRGTPLGVVRRATRIPTEVLRAAGVAPARRDPWAREADPDDVYDLVPATWADLGPACGEAGLVWGAAKALRHLARHRPPRD
jgi:hypothetical protein